MSSIQSILPSRLPVPTKEKTMTRQAPRRALGDITTQKLNNLKLGPKAVELKPRVTRLATRRLGKSLAAIQVTEVTEDVAMDEEFVLPFGVKDIDKEDADNPQLCSEYALEMFAYLRQLEGRGAVRPGHLSGCPTNDKMRAVLIDWLVEVQMQFKLLQETLFGTVDLVDRYLAVEGGNITRSKLQLIGVSCMFVAAKVEEVYAPACSDFVYITDNAYSEDDIKKTELKILTALQFNLFQPISLHFLRRFSKAGDVDVLQHSLAKYALEVGLLDYSLVSVSGSEMAAASLFLSLLLLEPDKDIDTVWTPTLAFYSSYSRDKLLPTASKLASGILTVASKKCKLQAVKIKYESGKFLKVAELPELNGEILAKLAALH